MGTEVGRYNYRLRPGALAERALIEEWHRCRFLWNEAVYQFKTGGKPKFLSKTSMARTAADAAVATVKRELIEQGRRAGRKVVVVRPAYTTMTCSGCFARAKQPLELAERIFRCWACGYTACRDRNAARVVLVVAERGHTGVDDVSQADHLLRGGAVAV